MRKREQEELRRLEAALLESEYEDTAAEDELELLEDTWQETADLDYQVYNTDDTDVDLEDYSEEVYRERSGSGLSVLVTILVSLLLGGAILLFLKHLGVF